MAGWRYTRNIVLVITGNSSSTFRVLSMGADDLLERFVARFKQPQEFGMLKNPLTLVLTFLLPALSYAQGADSYECKMGELTRRVEIIRETGVTVPCEVHYYKDTEAPGERQVLWRALNEEGYCEAKMTEFVGKLLEMGWECGMSAAPPEAATPEESDSELPDDTEALAPAPPEIEN